MYIKLPLLFREIFVFSPLPIYAADTNGTLIYFNSASVQFSGFVPEPEKNRWCICNKLYYPDGKPMPHESSPLARAIKKGEVISGAETITERPDGSRAWFRSYPSLLYGKNGEIRGGWNLIVDISRDKTLEAHPDLTKQELEDFFENANVGFHVTAADGTIKKANKKLLKMLGYTKQEFVGKPIAQFHSHQGVVEHIMDRLSKEEEVQDYEVGLKRKDGSIRQALLNSSKYSKDGEYIHTRCITRDITLPKKIEADLLDLTVKSEQQKRLYEALFSSTPDSAFVFDLNHRFLVVNPALLERLGRTREEVIGKNLHGAGLEPWEVEKYGKEIDEVIQSKKAVKGENSITQQSESRYFEYIMVPVVDENGKVEAVAGTTRDITDRKKNELALATSEKKYRTLFEQMNEGFCIVEIQYGEAGNPIDFCYLEANPAFEKQTGLKNIVGMHATEILQKPEEEVNKYGRVVTTGEPYQAEEYIEQLNCWLDVSAFRYGSKEQSKVAILYNNITKRKNEEEKCARLLDHIKLEQERLADIFQHAPFAMCILWGPDHELERANDLFTEMCGREIVMGQPVKQLFPDLKGQGLFERLDEVYDTGKPYSEKNRKIILNPSKTGNQPAEYYVDFVYQPLHDSDGKVNRILIQSVDLTERKIAQDNLKAINETLEERVQQRTKTLLSYQRQLRALASRLNRAEENQRHLLAAELHDNLGQLLAVSKMEIAQLRTNPASGSHELTQVEELLEEALSYTRNLMTQLKPPPSINKDIRSGLDWLADQFKKRELNVVIEDDNEPKPVTKEVLTMVIQSVRELLFNVIKHSTVKEATVKLRRKADQLEVIVKDDGKGFDLNKTELMPEDGKRFGLFNVQERIFLNGGDFNIKTASGKGTEVIFYVPLLSKKQEPASASPAQQTSGHEKTPPTLPQQTVGSQTDKTTVLLVDDHQMVRTGLRMIIENHEDIVVVGEADSGEQAIELVRELSPDIILMDINMPGMDGIETTRRITTDETTLPPRIIGLSLHDEKRVITDMKNAGATAYLTKSEAFESLITTIRSEAAALKLNSN